MSTSHGGNRSGAGRPKGGISQARRLINVAITRGLAHAGQIRYPQQVDGNNVEEAATQTAAMIVSDMIQAGQGNDVIKIWSQVAMKDNDKESTSNNILAEALARLPSPSHVSDVPRNHVLDTETTAATGLTDNRPTDYNSDGEYKQPFFTPQACLPLDDIDEREDLPPIIQPGQSLWPGATARPNEPER